MIDKADRQSRVQRKAEPHIARAFGAMLDHGITPADAAQAFILSGVGMLVRAIGPEGAGHTLREVAEAQNRWLLEMAESVERITLHFQENGGNL